MQHDAAYELDMIVDHVPCDHVAAGHPLVFVDRFVAFDCQEVFSLSGEFAVKVGCGDFDGRVGGEAGCGLAHCGEDDGEMFVKLVLYDVEHVLFMTVNLVPERLALVDWKSLDFETFTVGGFLVGGHGLTDVGAHLGYFLTELVGGKGFELFAESFYFIYYRLDFTQVTV